MCRDSVLGKERDRPAAASRIASIFDIAGLRLDVHVWSLFVMRCLPVDHFCVFGLELGLAVAAFGMDTDPEVGQNAQ